MPKPCNEAGPGGVCVPPGPGTVQEHACLGWVLYTTSDERMNLAVSRENRPRGILDSRRGHPWKGMMQCHVSGDALRRLQGRTNRNYDWRSQGDSDTGSEA